MDLMTIRFATPDELLVWNDQILHNPDKGNVFQGLEFAEQKKLGGWTPRFIIAGHMSITVLEKTVLGLGKLWYLPKGPGVVRTKELQSLVLPLTQFSSKNGVFAIKIEPELRKTPETLADLLKLQLTKVAPIQPNFSTVTLDLSGSLDEIMANLNQKGRHAIKRAERDGVTVRQVPATEENCKYMYDLLEDTAHGSFRIRSYNYYKEFWQRYASAALGQLFFAYVDGKIVAGAFAIVFGTKSTYKDGASVRERTAYGASHLLQWHVIEWAKLKGAVIHDFCGAPPSDQIKNADHPHYGIGRFKTSFNKEVTDYVGAYDIPVKPFQYRLWQQIGERVTLRLYNQKHHENYY
jgi:lipid II:glycine glycyltransferase (peptidoglycan interpeptide bridge formation enzyme)